MTYKIKQKITEEIWKTISEFPEYEVSNQGRIRYTSNQIQKRLFFRRNELCTELSKSYNNTRMRMIMPLRDIMEQNGFNYVHENINSRYDYRIKLPSDQVTTESTKLLDGQILDFFYEAGKKDPYIQFTVIDVAAEFAKSSQSVRSSLERLIHQDKLKIDRNGRKSVFLSEERGRPQNLYSIKYPPISNNDFMDILSLIDPNYIESVDEAIAENPGLSQSQLEELQELKDEIQEKVNRRKTHAD